MPNGLQVENDDLVAEHEASLDAILELADVAGPCMSPCERERPGVESFARAVLVVQTLQKCARQQLDVIAASAQRRQAHDEYREAIEKILAQPAVAQNGFGRMVARRDDADVDGDLLGAADTDHAAGFEDAKHFRLQVERHFGDFVEEQRSAGCALEVTLVLSYGAGEGAALVPEELGFDQIRRDRAAVHCYDGSARARAVGVQELRSKLLAGTRFADQHHGGLRRCDAAQLRGDLSHFRRFANQLAVAGRLGLGPHAHAKTAKTPWDAEKLRSTWALHAQSTRHPENEQRKRCLLGVRSSWRLPLVPRRRSRRRPNSADSDTGRM